MTALCVLTRYSHSTATIASPAEWNKVRKRKRLYLSRLFDGRIPVSQLVGWADEGGPPWGRGGPPSSAHPTSCVARRCNEGAHEDATQKAVMHKSFRLALHALHALYFDRWRCSKGVAQRCNATSGRNGGAGVWAGPHFAKSRPLTANWQRPLPALPAV